ncbi:MAG: hypothetical protein EOP54_04185 [Sphingobacteriales bacterium]|nr:MAG: hypothetical protein EOP54_04185 [Sphingobacteriales bacterium]
MLQPALFAIAVLLFTGKAAYAQRYEGVHLKRIVQKSYKEKAAPGQFCVMAGLKRSMGVQERSTEQLPQVKLDFAYFSISLQLTLKYERKNWHAQLYYLKQHFDAGDVYSYEKGLNHNCLYLNGLGLGLNYHWFRDENWTCYSGLSGGFSYGIIKPFDPVKGSYITLKYRLIDYQLTAFGVAYRHKRFGGFLELSYGTMGLGQLGFSYKLSKA